jgi:acetyltransferase-like isoleucine patch superfamily enzyme
MTLRGIINTHLATIYFKLYSKFFRKNLMVNNGVRVHKLPAIYLRNNGKITIGKNVTLNSNNRGYHINMHNKVKLMADRQGAEIIIGDNTRIHGSCLHAYKSIKIGENCLIAANCQIIDGSGHDLSFDRVSDRIKTLGGAREIIIEDNVWIGANCIILPGSKIGAGSVIAAGSVVNKEIPSMCLAGGNPIEIFKQY